MQIHELNSFTGSLDAGSFVAVDNGDDTGKISIKELLSDTENEIDALDESLNARIDNIIAGGAAPSESEIVDARLGASVLGSILYTALGGAIRGQSTDLFKTLSESLAVPTVRVSSSGSINSGGTITTTASGMACYKAPVKAGHKYKIITHDSSLVVCAFFYNEPEVNSVSYDGSRIIQTDSIFVDSPIDGWIAFRSSDVQTDEAVIEIAATDGVARAEADAAQNNIANYRQMHTVINDSNIYNSEYLKQGYWIQSDGSLGYSPTSYYALIPVVGGNNIAVCMGISSLYMSIAVLGGFAEFDKDLNLINTQDFGDARRDESLKYNDCWVGRFSLDNDTQFVAFTAKLTSTWDARNTIIVAYGNDLSNYTGQGNTISSWDGFNVSQAKWAGKKWGVIGDSITAINATATVKYYSLIRNKTGIIIDNVAIDGSGYAKKAGSNEAFIDQATSLSADCDVVTVFGSGNDNTAGLQIGNITDSGNSTLCGRINALIDYMIANHPTVGFGIITPTPWENWEPSDNLYWMAEYSEAIVKICNRRGVPCLDLYHCSNLHPSDPTFNALAFANADGTHPNNVGHAIIAPRIQSFVESLLL